MIANGVVIRPEETNPSLLQHVNVIKCPDSYKIYGDIGTNGVLLEETKQTFDFIIPSQIDFKKSSAYLDKKKIYFLNGFLITNDSLRISKNAITRTEVLTSKNYANTSNSDGTVLINIWILKEKEIRKSLKNCQRSYD